MSRFFQLIGGESRIRAIAVVSVCQRSGSRNRFNCRVRIEGDAVNSCSVVIFWAAVRAVFSTVLARRFSKRHWERFFSICCFCVSSCLRLTLTSASSSGVALPRLSKSCLVCVCCCSYSLIQFCACKLKLMAWFCNSPSWRGFSLAPGKDFSAVSSWLLNFCVSSAEKNSAALPTLVMSNRISNRQIRWDEK